MTDERNSHGQIVGLDTQTAIERGRKGGKARVQKGISMLTPERRREIALKGVEKRKQLKEERENGRN